MFIMATRLEDRKLSAKNSYCREATSIATAAVKITSSGGALGDE